MADKWLIDDTQRRLYVLVNVFVAKNLRDHAVLLNMDPFVGVSLYQPRGSQWQYTGVHSNGGKHPLWNHRIQLPFAGTDNPVLQCRVWDKNMLASDTMLGGVDIELKPLLQMMNRMQEPRWFPLCDPLLFDDDFVKLKRVATSGEDRGMIRLAIGVFEVPQHVVPDGDEFGMEARVSSGVFSASGDEETLGYGITSSGLVATPTVHDVGGGDTETKSNVNEGNAPDLRVKLHLGFGAEDSEDDDSEDDVDGSLAIVKRLVRDTHFQPGFIVVDILKVAGIVNGEAASFPTGLLASFCLLRDPSLERARSRSASGAAPPAGGRRPSSSSSGRNSLEQRLRALSSSEEGGGEGGEERTSWLSAAASSMADLLSPRGRQYTPILGNSASASALAQRGRNRVVIPYEGLSGRHPALRELPKLRLRLSTSTASSVLPSMLAGLFESEATSSSDAIIAQGVINMWPFFMARGSWVGPEWLDLMGFGRSRGMSSFSTGTGSGDTVRCSDFRVLLSVCVMDEHVDGGVGEAEDEPLLSG